RRRRYRPRRRRGGERACATTAAASPAALPRWTPVARASIRRRARAVRSRRRRDRPARPSAQTRCALCVARANQHTQAADLPGQRQKGTSGERGRLAGARLGETAEAADLAIGAGEDTAVAGHEVVLAVGVEPDERREDEDDDARRLVGLRRRRVGRVERRARRLRRGLLRRRRRRLTDLV